MYKKLLIVTAIEGLVLVYTSLISVFGIIFFYQIFANNIFLALLPFGICHLLYAFSVAYTTRLTGTIGLRNSLLLSMVLFIATAPLIYLFSQTNNIGLIIIWFVLFYLAKAFFHPAMIYLLGSVTTHEQRGTQMGLRSVILMGTITLTPIVGGFISDSYGFLGIVLVSVLMIGMAIVPITYLENSKFTVHFKLWTLLAKPQIQRLWLANGIFEFQLSGERIWPIYVFAAFGGSFIAVGNLIGITAGITIIAMLLLGKFLNNHDRISTLRRLFYLNTLSWLGRALATQPFTVAITNLFGRLTKDLAMQTLDTFNYDAMNDAVKSADRDEVVIAREMGINIAIGLSALGLGALFATLGFQWGFLLVSLIGLSSILIRR
jgi:MFS family permease